MKLFIFEGRNPEDEIFRSMERLFPSSPEERIIQTFDCNIYSLYDRMKSLDGYGDVVNVMKELYRKRDDNPFTEGMDSSSFSEIFLFFDYDLHHPNNLTFEEKDSEIEELLSFFSDETDNGKLYISYPMAEAIWHTKELEDPCFSSYCVPIDKCHSFKRLAAEFNGYKNHFFICFNEQHGGNNEEVLRNNWLLLIKQHVSKVRFIRHDEDYAPPSLKIVISQLELFTAIRTKYVSAKGLIPILSAFPIYLYDNYKDIVLG
ncbi:MAG: hypothetical protein IJ202_14750 [Bacteroidales bacterium]|nr:hypothetical protein [Bacteroidales bacterium]